MTAPRDPHLVGLSWFKHPYDVEYDEATGRYRGTCACPWRGPWRHHEAVAERDAEQHPNRADYAWADGDRRVDPGRHRVENPPRLALAALGALGIVAALVALVLIFVA